MVPYLDWVDLHRLQDHQNCFDRLRLDLVSTALVQVASMFLPTPNPSSPETHPNLKTTSYLLGPLPFNFPNLKLCAHISQV
jgi:hypothetical protein